MLTAKPSRFARVRRGENSKPKAAWRGNPGVRRFLAALTAVAMAGGLWLVAGSTVAASADTSSLCPDATVAAFGPNVCVFNDNMSQAAIQADLDAISTQQVPVDSQFDSQRYAIFFEPGSYGSVASPLVFQVGYYTQVAGLG